MLLDVYKDLRTVRDGEPRTSTSSLTQLLSYKRSAPTKDHLKNLIPKVYLRAENPPMRTRVNLSLITNKCVEGVTSYP